MTFEAITTAVGNLGTVLTTTLGTIADNAMLMIMIAVPVVGAGCDVFGKVIKAARK